MPCPMEKLNAQKSNIPMVAFFAAEFFGANTKGFGPIPTRDEAVQLYQLTIEKAANQ